MAKTDTIATKQPLTLWLTPGAFRRFRKLWRSLNQGKLRVTQGELLERLLDAHEGREN